MTDKPRFFVTLSNKAFSTGICQSTEGVPSYEYERLAHVGYFDVQLLSKFFATCRTLVDTGQSVEIGIMTRGEKDDEVCLIARPSQAPTYPLGRLQGFCMVAPRLNDSQWQHFGKTHIVLVEDEK